MGTKSNLRHLSPTLLHSCRQRHPAASLANKPPSPGLVKDAPVQRVGRAQRGTGSHPAETTPGRTGSYPHGSWMATHMLVGATSVASAIVIEASPLSRASGSELWAQGYAWRKPRPEVCFGTLSWEPTFTDWVVRAGFHLPLPLRSRWEFLPRPPSLADSSDLFFFKLFRLLDTQVSGVWMTQAGGQETWDSDAAVPHIFSPLKSEPPWGAWVDPWVKRRA